MGVSDDLYHFIHDLWLENAPIGELSWQTYALENSRWANTTQDDEDEDKDGMEDDLNDKDNN